MLEYISRWYFTKISHVLLAWVIEDQWYPWERSLSTIIRHPRVMYLQVNLKYIEIERQGLSKKSKKEKSC